MSRLIVVSNRVNPPADAGVGTAGGLAMAMAAALRRDQGVWFGWSGETVEAFTGEPKVQQVGGVTVALLDLEEQDVQEYYNGYANRTLWPLFHYRTDLTAYERSFSEGYVRVNQRFAEALRPMIRPDDVIWVQDYHLIPLARALRRLGVKNRIGWFLHVPWPARRVYVTLPRHRELVEALFDYDLLGFQTQDFADAFADYVREEAPGEVDADGTARAFDRSTRIAAFPIGIDAVDFAEAVRSPMAEEMRKRVSASVGRQKLLLGVDRLDYSKGLPERFDAFDRFLTSYPEQRGRVTFLQVATPSRDDVDAYQSLRQRLDAESGRINGEHATVDWAPLRYVNRPYRRDELAGIYRAAHVALVTPLRDGMNLVAKEYVAAQDPADPGVLILSRFAGTAAQMPQALVVNPMDRDEMSEAIRSALAMPLAARRRRWEAMMAGVTTDDVTAWRESFVSALTAS